MDRDHPVIATDGEEGDVFRDAICKGVENNSRQESFDPTTVVTWRRTGELVADEHQKLRPGQGPGTEVDLAEAFPKLPGQELFV